MYMEPAFPLVLEFPLLTGLQQSVVQLSSVHLLMLFCSCLVSGGPPGSSCFCAGLRQKPYVSSGTIHQRTPSRICGGSGDNSGIKGGTDMEGYFKKKLIHAFSFSLISYVPLLIPYPHSTPHQVNVVQYLSYSSQLARLDSVNYGPKTDSSMDNLFGRGKRFKCNPNDGFHIVFVFSSAKQ